MLFHYCVVCSVIIFLGTTEKEARSTSWSSTWSTDCTRTKEGVRNWRRRRGIWFGERGQWCEYFRRLGIYTIYWRLHKFHQDKGKRKVSPKNNKSTNNKSKTSSPAKSRGRPARAAATKAKSKNDATSEEEDEEEPEKDEESEDEPLSKKAKTAEPTVNIEEFGRNIECCHLVSLLFVGRWN